MLIYCALVVATFGEALLGHLGEDAAEVGETVVGLAIEGLELFTWIVSCVILIIGILLLLF